MSKEKASRPRVATTPAGHPSMTALERIARVLEQRGFRHHAPNRWILPPFKITARTHPTGWVSLNLYGQLADHGNAWINSAHVDPTTRNMGARLRNFLAPTS